MLILCVECRRHVESGEPACPFCGAVREAPAGRSQSLGATLKSATMAVGMGLAVAACGGPDDGGQVAVYGPPPMQRDSGGEQPPVEDPEAQDDSGASDVEDTGGDEGIGEP